MSEELPVFKVVMLGDGGAGKTAFTLQVGTIVALIVATKSLMLKQLTP